MIKKFRSDFFLRHCCGVAKFPAYSTVAKSNDFDFFSSRFDAADADFLLSNGF